MRLHKKLYRMVTWFLACSFIGSCAVQNRVLVKPDAPMPLEGKVVVIHWMKYAYELTDVSIDNGRLSGIRKGMPFSGKRKIPKKNSIHFFYKQNRELTFIQGRLSIPMSDIDHVEYDQFDPGKSVANSAIVVVVVTIVTVIAFAIALADFSGPNLSGIQF